MTRDSSLTHLPVFREASPPPVSAFWRPAGLGRRKTGVTRGAGA
jgi:hypothetical protein